MTQTLRISGSARAGLYVFAFALAFWPMADLLMNVWPPQPGNVQWRYGFAGLLSAFLHTPMLGLVLAMAVAYVGGQPKVLRALGLLQLVIAIALIVIATMFGLDLLQVRALRPADSLPAMFVGGATAAAKYLTASVALALMGLGAMKMARTSTGIDKAGSGSGVIIKS